MDDETRSAIGGLAQEMRAGFARMDRYFELRQAQYQELRREFGSDVAGLRGEVQGLRTDVNGLRSDVEGLRAEFRGFRD